MMKPLANIGAMIQNAKNPAYLEAMFFKKWQNIFFQL